MSVPAFFCLRFFFSPGSGWTERRSELAVGVIEEAVRDVEALFQRLRRLHARLDTLHVRVEFNGVIRMRVSVEPRGQKRSLKKGGGENEGLRGATPPNTPAVILRQYLYLCTRKTSTMSTCSIVSASALSPLTSHSNRASASQGAGLCSRGRGLVSRGRGLVRTGGVLAKERACVVEAEV